MLKDERGFYLVVSLSTLLLIGIPIIALIIGIGEMMVARSEAQVMTDAIALDIANQSTKHYQDNFQTTNSCSDITYIGKEPYLTYIGDVEAKGVGYKRYQANNPKMLTNFSIVSIAIRDPYIPESNTNQEIPDSLKKSSHSPYVMVTTKSTFHPLFAKLWGGDLTVTRTGESRKFYPDAILNRDRVEIYPAHPPCPRPTPTPDDNTGNSTDNSFVDLSL